MSAPLVGEGGLGVPAGVGGKGAGEMTGEEVLKPAGSTREATFAGWGVGGGLGAGVGPGFGAALGWGVSAGVGPAVVAGVGEVIVAAAPGDFSEVGDNINGAVVSGKGWVTFEGGGGRGGRGCC